MLQFDDRFIPERPEILVCLLKATLQSGERVQFEVTAAILMDVLKVGNPVDHLNNVAQCERARARIEEACRTAYAKRPSDKIALSPADFLAAARA
jgi:hypothetical protein